MDKTTTQITIEKNKYGSPDAVDWAINMGYVHRWAIQGVKLPDAVRTRVANWFRNDPDFCRLYEPLIYALENNSPDMILKECL